MKSKVFKLFFSHFFFTMYSYFVYIGLIAELTKKCFQKKNLPDVSVFDKDNVRQTLSAT